MSADKVLILHNQVTPYRLPLFERLNEKYDVTVYFCKRKTKDRKWDVSLENYSFDYKTLPEFDISKFWINLTLPFMLLLNRYDFYIAGENTNHLFSTFIVLLFAKVLEKPFILWSEVIETKYSKKSGKYGKISSLFKKFKEIYRKFLYGVSDAIVAYSKKAENYVKKRINSTEKIFSGKQVMPEKLIPNTPQNNSKKALGFNGKIVILSLGYLRAGKGIQVLIDAYRKLDSKNSSALIVAGDGPQRENLELQAEDEENIHFIGHTKGKKKAKYYSIADIFVLPTYHDSWGLVLNEATYYGLPLITTYAAGAAELVERAGNGFIIESGSITELEKALKKLVDDKELRKNLSKKSKKFSEKATDVDEGIKPFLKAISYVNS